MHGFLHMQMALIERIKEFKYVLKNAKDIFVLSYILCFDHTDTDIVGIFVDRMSEWCRQAMLY